MRSRNLRTTCLVVAAVTLAACATQSAQDTASTGTSTTAASTTVVEDSVGPTTSGAESGASTVGSTEPTTTLPDLGLPGMNLDEPAGEYGWTGERGSRGWLHRVVEDPPGVTRQTQLAFAVDDDCFAGAPGAEPTAVAVAGRDGLYLEPYDDDSLSWSTSHPSGGETMGAYALPIGDRTLCTYLRWDPATTPDELSAARKVVESIRGEPYGENGIRINFTLPAGWDTG